MEQLWRDVVSMAGVVIIRRLVGIAHTADMDNIPDRAQRAAAERRALRFGRHLLVEGAAAYKDVGALVEGAEAARAAEGLPH
jgi:5-methylthioribose kinase